MEDKLFCQLKRTSSYRKRYDSEMNFSDFVDLYGVVPDPPILKPSKDPNDNLPLFELEQPTIEEKEKEEEDGRVFEKLEPIPQIENSQNNSIDFGSRNFEMLNKRLSKKESIIEGEKDEQNPKKMSRRRRCQSQCEDYEILTFLSNSCRQKKRFKNE